MVFVIDSCHRDRLMEAHSELAKLLTEKELRDALLLIFANKQVLAKTKQSCASMFPPPGPAWLLSGLFFCVRRTSPAWCRWRR